MPIWVSVHGAKELQALAKRLKDSGRGDLQKRLRRNIRDAGRPVVSDIRKAVMAVNVTRGNDPFRQRTERTGVAPRRSTSRWGPRSTGLRARVARSTGISQTRRGIRIRVSEKRFGPYGKSMPRYLDATLARYRRLRHPVFGNRNVWVEHKGQPYFFVSITKRRASFRRAVFAAMDATARDLTK